MLLQLEWKISGEKTIGYAHDKDDQKKGLFSAFFMCKLYVIVKAAKERKWPGHFLSALCGGLWISIAGC